MIRRLLWIAAAAALLGCGHGRGTGSETTPDEGWTLTIHNRHWLDVSIYVMSDGQRSHVGMVPAVTTESYDLPARMIGTGRLIVIEADPVGATRTVRTERLSVQGGQHVEWTLEHGLERSNVAVW
jgi:hypothetical protein